MKCLTCVVICFILNNSFAIVSYNGYKIVRMKLNNNDVDINELEDTYGLDVLSYTDKSIDILFSPHQYDETLSIFLRNGFKEEVIVKDVQKLIELQQRQPSPTYFSFNDLIDLDEYHNLEEINEYINKISEKFPNYITVSSIGTTYEGRDINIVTLNDPKGDQSRLALWIDCGIHAREWISPATCLYILDYIVNGYNTNDTIVLDLLQNHIIYILPVLNPDGYEYSWTVDRMWRKNRYPNNDNNCTGVDLNRNYDTPKWGTLPSVDSCSLAYQGTAAFSEAETKAVRDFINNIGASNFKAMFNLHSYGQLWLYPFAYTIEIMPPEIDEMLRVIQTAVNAIFDVNGFKYVKIKVRRATTGLSFDWGYSIGIVHSYLLELRDTGTHGFLLPGDQIIPNASEVLAGLLAAINAI